jgi:hypothetical protein
MKCGHAPCDCEAKAQLDGYCSTQCADADEAGGGESQCRCGHPGCTVEDRPQA